MVYGLKENGYFELFDGPVDSIHIMDDIPAHIKIVATPDERLWCVNRYYENFMGYNDFITVADPITIT